MRDLLFRTAQQPASVQRLFLTSPLRGFETNAGATEQRPRTEQRMRGMIAGIDQNPGHQFQPNHVLTLRMMHGEARHPFPAYPQNIFQKGCNTLWRRALRCVRCGLLAEGLHGGPILEIMLPAHNVFRLTELETFFPLSIITPSAVTGPALNSRRMVSRSLRVA